MAVAAKPDDDLEGLDFGAGPEPPENRGRESGWFRLVPEWLRRRVTAGLWWVDDHVKEKLRAWWRGRGRGA